MSHEDKEKKQYSIWILIPLGIVGFLLILVLLGFIVLLAPIFMLAYIAKMYYDLKAEKHEKNLKAEYAYKTNEKVLKVDLIKEKLRLKCQTYQKVD